MKPYCIKKEFFPTEIAYFLFNVTYKKTSNAIWQFKKNNY
jgi:hypothetical protein